LYAFENGNSGDIFVQKSPASSIAELANAMIKIYDSKVNIKIIGTRHAEKLYETLLAKEEFLIANDLGKYYRVAADNRDLNYNKYFTEGSVGTSKLEEYHSHNTRRLSETELIHLLNSIGYKKQ
jgi:UDP-glucose 4-epimerase